jgi:hypothetical protein
MEWKLFEGDVPYVSTAEFHADRERAPHVEQPLHRTRMDLALDCVRAAAHWYGEPTLSDLGAGDGGFLSLVTPWVSRAWGYDFCPANLVGAQERGMDVRNADFTKDPVEFGMITVMTEVLEHVADPHGILRMLKSRGVQVMVASSPYVETDVSHDACHAWAWDEAGYRELFENAGWTVARHETVPYFQVILARR